MPMCTVGFRPENRGKSAIIEAGLYQPRAQQKKAAPWMRRSEAKNHELWRMDLREVDLGLVEDKLERAVREIYNNYLLTDAGNARLVLVMPSVMPHPLLSVVLETLFNRWRFPSITLLPSAAMVAAAAGVRAALVVDIGWAETTIIAIYEYRDISSRRSTRAMKTLMQRIRGECYHIWTIRPKNIRKRTGKYQSISNTAKKS